MILFYPYDWAAVFVWTRLNSVRFNTSEFISCLMQSKSFLGAVQEARLWPSTWSSGKKKLSSSSLKGKCAEQSINTRTGENKFVPVNAAKWAPLQSISLETNTAVKHYRCKWAVLLCLSGLCSSRTCKHSICLHAKRKNTDWHTSQSLHSSLTTS